MGDWDEKKYEWVEEQKRAMKHDCINESAECDTVHPNIAKNIIAQPPKALCRYQPHPKDWRKWLQTPKVSMMYLNQHTLKMEAFNLSEAFNQMSTSAKLNVFNSMFTHLLDDDEKSLFLSDILGDRNAAENR